MTSAAAVIAPSTMLRMVPLPRSTGEEPASAPAPVAPPAEGIGR